MVICVLILPETPVPLCSLSAGTVTPFLLRGKLRPSKSKQFAHSLVNGRTESLSSQTSYLSTIGAISLLNILLPEQVLYLFIPSPNIYWQALFWMLRIYSEQNG